MSIWTKIFWRATSERGIKTFAQTLGALLVADGTGLLDSAWGPRLSVAGMAAFVSICTSIASSAATDDGSPSLGGGEVLEAAAVAPTGNDYAGKHEGAEGQGG